MAADGQTICIFCGTKNRIGRRSIKKIPWCGKCGKPLPESFPTKGIRFAYRYPPIVFLVALWAFILWVGRESIIDSVSMSFSCSVKQEPNPGIYGRYTTLPRSVPFTIETPAGSNYFVKLLDAQTNTPLLSFFVHGGEPLTAKVPVGDFILRAASGEAWCGETNLFGGGTTIIEAGRTITFEPNEIHTVSLKSHFNGNLPVRTIARGNF